MSGEGRDSRDPNVDTFDHVGERATAEAEALVGAWEKHGNRGSLVEAVAAAIATARTGDELEKRIAALEEREAIRSWRQINPLNAPLIDAIHEAGPLVDGLQQCRRCFVLLSDYRGTMQLSSDPPLTGYTPGAFVATAGPASWVTTEAPTCGAAS